MPCRRLGSVAFWIHRTLFPIDHIVVDTVLDPGRVIGHPKNSLVVGLILSEQQRNITVAIQPPFAKCGVRCLNSEGFLTARHLFKNWLRCVCPPGPCITKPECWQDLQRSCFRSSIAHSDPDQNVLWRLLRILHKYVEVAIGIEDAGVQKFIFRVAAIAAFTGLDQVTIGKRRLRIFVQILHVRMSRRAIQVEVILFDILTVVAFAVCQSKQALFEYWILAVPQRDAETQQLFFIADTGEAILTPVIRAGSCLIVSEIVPGISILAVVFANRAPLALAKIGSHFLHGILAARACCSLVVSALLLIFSSA